MTTTSHNTSNRLAIALLLFATILLFPTLGSFGLWESTELPQADVARDLATHGDFSDVTVGGRHAPRPVLSVWLSAIGFKILGLGELGGRLPLALCGLFALLLAYYFGSRLLDRRSGLSAAFVLCITPTFLFQSRQLGGDVVYFCCLVAAVGGPLAYVWPNDSKRRIVDLILGCAGLVLGFLAAGAVLGTALPLLLVGVTFLSAWLAPTAPDSVAENTTGTEKNALSRDIASTLPALGVALLGSGAVIGLILSLIRFPVGLAGGEASGYSGAPLLLLGAMPHAIGIPPSFEQPLVRLGYGTFPWFGLLPVAMACFIWPSSDHSDTTQKDRVYRVLGHMVVLAFVLGYLASVAWSIFFTPIRFPTLPLLAIGIGLWVAKTSAAQQVRPFWGLAAAGFIIALHQDMVTQPESLAFAHILSTLQFPVEVSIKSAIRVAGIGFAAALYFTLSVDTRSADDTTDSAAQTPLSRLARMYLRVTKQLSALVRPFLPALRWLHRRIWTLCALGAALFAIWCVYWLTPALSYHMSARAVFETFKACRANESTKLLRYRASSRSAPYYTGGELITVNSEQAVFSALQRPQRQFVLIPTDHLAPFDRNARRQHVPYFVLDDRSSKFLIISNQLGGSCNQDRNPLRHFVTRTAPNPQHRITANFQNRVELIGYDIPDEVSTGGKFKFTLYYHVLGTMPSNQKVFVHFDKPAGRVHGDHTPLDGKYPTQYWMRGDYIIDTHEVSIPFLTTSPGVYRIYMGFYLGSKRLKVSHGSNDGSDRVFVGTLRVRAGL